MKIIAFTGSLESGKTTAANFINKKGARLSFAFPVKKIAKEQFGWDGKKDKKGRKLLQIIGTEAGRNYNPNIWVEKMEELFKHQLLLEKSHKYETIIKIDDLRFNNEAELVKKYNGYILKIYKDNETFFSKLIKIFRLFKKTHLSEKGIDNKYINYHIKNTGTIEELKAKIIGIVNDLIKKEK